MSDTQVPDKVILRIRRMLALANDKRGNENEAANAASMAQAMIAEYGLSLAQLETGAADATEGGKRAKNSHDRSAMYKYQRDLMTAVANVHFCRYWIEEVHTLSSGKMRNVKRHVLLGRTINIEAAKIVYDYLIDTMDRLLPWQGTEKRGKQALLWLEGCSFRLAERLADKRRQMEAESQAKKREEDIRAKHPGAATVSNALVLADAYSSEDDLNNDFVNGWAAGTTAQNRREQDARWAESNARHKKLKSEYEAKGHSSLVSHYLAYGYSPDSARHYAGEDKVSDKPKPETEKQRQAREAKEKRQEQENARRYYNRNKRSFSSEYQMGARQGEKIGLDAQVGHSERARIK